MSVSSYGMIEIQLGSGCWFPIVKPYFYGDVNALSVLAHPWGEWSPEDDDLPGPVVKPRGLPSDISIEVRCLTHHALNGEPEDRPCTAEEAKGMIEGPYPGLFFDPDEWRCTTWLATEEVAKACDLYSEAHHNSMRSPELESCLAVMKLHEGLRLNTRTRLVLWFR